MADFYTQKYKSLCVCAKVALSSSNNKMQNKRYFYFSKQNKENEKQKQSNLPPSKSSPVIIFGGVEAIFVWNITNREYGFCLKLPWVFFNAYLLLLSFASFCIVLSFVWDNTKQPEQTNKIKLRIYFLLFFVRCLISVLFYLQLPVILRYCCFHLSARLLHYLCSLIF